MAKNFLVETSARHVHLTKEDVETLFGAGHVLTNKKDLSQPGQYACEEKVELVGPKAVTAEGGMCGTYIRTVGKTGTVRLTVAAALTDPVTVEFSVS